MQKRRRQMVQENDRLGTNINKTQYLFFPLILLLHLFFFTSYVQRSSSCVLPFPSAQLSLITDYALEINVKGELRTIHLFSLLFLLLHSFIQLFSVHRHPSILCSPCIKAVSSLEVLKVLWGPFLCSRRKVRAKNKSSLLPTPSVVINFFTSVVQCSPPSFHPLFFRVSSF